MKYFVNTIIILLLSVSFHVYGGDVYVEGYYRADGTYVAPHYRSGPNHTKLDNWTTKGNVNPYTGEDGTRTYNNYNNDESYNDHGYSSPSGNYSSNRTYLYEGKDCGDFDDPDDCWHEQTYGFLTRLHPVMQKTRNASKIDYKTEPNDELPLGLWFILIIVILLAIWGLLLNIIGFLQRVFSSTKP
jgi:hypothetical protein